MALDIIRGCRTGKDWSCGMGSDLPSGAKGYVPESFWGPDDMETKVTSFMSKPKGLFGSKPSREEAIDMLALYMRKNKIGPTGLAGLSSDIGSILFPVKEQKVMLDKIDDVRYDIRSARGILGAGMFALAGGLAFIGLAKVYKASVKAKA